jgi:dihydroflavonol-4-reductase
LLLAALRSSRPWLVETYVSIVDIADCTSGHLAAAERGRSGERYLLSGAPAKVSDIVDLVAEGSGSQLDPRWLSEGVVRSFGRPAARVLSWIRPSSGICPALVDTLLHGHRFDAGRSERELGITYRPLPDTISRTIDWLRSEGLVD